VGKVYQHHYTLVGSRSITLDGVSILTRIAAEMAKHRWIGRSGGADGADRCLELGSKMVGDRSPNEIYLPWKGFNKDKMIAPPSHCIVAPDLPNYQEAVQIASETHPNWNACSRGAKALHTRNVYQVLGKDLVSPSKLLVCWAPPVSSKGDRIVVKGGTNTAVQLAQDYGVKVVNVHGMDWKHVVECMKDILNEIIGG
jgi:hypothetical protein